MNNTQSPKCPHVFLYLRAPFCYLVRSFGHLSSPSVSDSPSTKASEQIKPTAFSVSTNKLTKRENASRRKKIRKQKKNIENYIYIYIYVYTRTMYQNFLMFLFYLKIRVRSRGSSSGKAFFVTEKAF